MLINEGGPTDIMHIPLATKLGRSIRNARMPEVNPKSMLTREQIWKDRFSKLRTRSLSATYNCFGMVFASRRTCIEHDQIEMILKDDGYNRIRPVDTKKGDIIIYRESPREKITHVGVVIDIKSKIKEADVELTILSQWGLNGEYFHRIEDVPPVYGQHWEIHTERRYDESNKTFLKD